MVESKKAGRIRDNIWLCYTLLFAVTALMAFMIFIIYGKSFIWQADGFMQHYPHIVNIRHMVKDLLLEHRIYFWTDGIGLGTDVIGTASIEFMDPFNYIAAAFPVKYMDIGYSFSCVAALYTAGLTMIAFLKYHEYSNFKLLAGGLSYALCNWGLGVINHSFFLLPLILFPLVILGIDKVFDKKNPLLLIISVTLSFLTFIYFAYMTAIAAFVYIIVKALNDKNVNMRAFWVLFFKFVGYIVISLLISLPIVVSVTLSILNAPKGSGYSESLIPSLKELCNFIPGFTNFAEIGTSYLYIGINALFTLLLPIIAVSAFKKRKLPAIMCMFNVIMVIVPAWGIITNGFGYRTGRWCYTLAFFGVYAMVDELDVIFDITPKQKKLCTIWAASQAALIVLLKATTATFSAGLTAVAFWNLICMVLFLSDTVNTKKAVAGLLAANIGISYFVAYSPFAGGKVGIYVSEGKSYDCYSNSVLRAYDKITEKDEGFFRVDNNEHYNITQTKNRFATTPANEALFWRARGIYGYFSTINQSFIDYNDSLLNSACNFRRIACYSMDNRSRLNFLCGVKYYLTEKDTENTEVQRRYAGYDYKTLKSIDGVDIQCSQLDPGLGYVFDSSITRSEFDKLTPPEREECMMKNVVVDDDNGIELSSPDLTNDVTELDYTISEDSDVKTTNGSFEINNKGEKLILNIDPEDYKECELYAQVCGLKRTHFTSADREERLEEQGEKDNRYDKVTNTVNDLFTEETDNIEYFITSNKITKRVLDTTGEPQGRDDIHDFMSNLGYAKDGNGRVTIDFKTPGKYTIKDVKLYVLPVSSFEEDANALSEHKFNVTSYESDHIEGTCEADSDSILYLSIPYHMGWKAVVDGEEVKPIKADICYLGVPISAGEHNVTLIYRPVFFKESILLMITGLIGAAGVSIGFEILRKKKSGRKKAAGKARGSESRHTS